MGHPAEAGSRASRRIADAVLYEGYMLWPYRASALKNRQRFTFGGVYPPAFEDRSELQAQVLLQGSEDAEVLLTVRFLHVIEREVLERDGQGGLRAVAELHAEGRRLRAGEETVEREFGPGAICVDAGEQLQRLAAQGGAVRRSWRALSGEVSLARERLDEALWRVTARVNNSSPWHGAGREDALRESFCSTHMVLRAEHGEWVSATDPPAALRAPARACENVGLWPVLVGEPHERAELLAAPIILEDHPQLAPESPGDLFDSSEIDEMLVLNILAMTDEERVEMRDGDPRARELLERTEALSREQIMGLHGAVRERGEAHRG